MHFPGHGCIHWAWHWWLSSCVHVHLPNNLAPGCVTRCICLLLGWSANWDVVEVFWNHIQGKAGTSLGQRFNFVGEGMIYYVILIMKLSLMLHASQLTPCGFPPRNALPPHLAAFPGLGYCFGTPGCFFLVVHLLQCWQSVGVAFCQVDFPGVFPAAICCILLLLLWLCHPCTPWLEGDATCSSSVPPLTTNCDAQMMISFAMVNSRG